jgi:hypothetical protein
MEIGGLDTPDLPAGYAYTMVSTSSTGGNARIRSVEVTQNPGATELGVVSKASGNCMTADTTATSPQSTDKSRTS